MAENKWEWLTDDELDEKLIEIENKNKFYKKYKDGSYEQALDSSGYTDIYNEKQRRKNL